MRTTWFNEQWNDVHCYSDVENTLGYYVSIIAVKLLDSDNNSKELFDATEMAMASRTLR